MSACTCACTAFGMCSLSGLPLYVCACSCARTAVGICSPSAVPIAHECVYGVRYLQLERCTSCARVCVLVRVRARRSVCALARSTYRTGVRVRVLAQCSVWAV